MPNTSMENSAAAVNELRVRGNDLFGLGNYSKAIEMYSKAIGMDSGNSLLFGNRALCHLKLKKYGQAYSDALKAVELDSKNLKAGYVQGCALLQMKQGKESFLVFSRLLELARIQGSPFYDEIHTCYRKSRHLKWEEEERERVQEEGHILNYIKGLVEKDGLAQVSYLESKRKNDGTTADPGDEDHFETERQVVLTKTETIIDNLSTTFAAADEQFRVRNVPEHFLCKITFEIMRDPIITPSGITYERKAIQEHFKKNGHIDPISRSPLNLKDLYPNLAIRDAIQEFLSQNEWAYDY